MKQNPRVITRRYLQHLSFAEVLQLVLNFEEEETICFPMSVTGFYTGVWLKPIKESSLYPEPL